MISLSMNRSNSFAQEFVPASATRRTTAPSQRHGAQTTVNTPFLLRVIEWFSAKRSAARATKQLAVTETISLGEKRFVSVVTVGGRQFLIGGGPNNVQLLSELGPTPVSDIKTEASFAKVLKKTAGPRALASKSTASKAATVTRARKTIALPKVAASHKVLPAVAAKVNPAPAASEGQIVTRRAMTTAPRKRQPESVFVNGGLA